MPQSFNWLRIFAAFSLTLTLLACESEETNDIGRAQACLDEAQGSADAARCFNMVAGYDSQKANIIKCSAKFIEGGVDTDRIVEAYRQITDSNDADKTSIYLGYLAFTDASNNTAVAAAAKKFCDRTGVKGLVYLANMAFVATTLSEAAGGFDTSSLANLQADMNALLADCQGGNATCTTQTLEDVAAVLPTIADTYCVGSNEDSDVCLKVTQAVDEYSDPAKRGRALMCLIDGKTPDSNGDC